MQSTPIESAALGVFIALAMYVSHCRLNQTIRQLQLQITSVGKETYVNPSLGIGSGVAIAAISGLTLQALVELGKIVGWYKCVVAPLTHTQATRGLVAEVE